MPLTNQTDNQGRGMYTGTLISDLGKMVTTAEEKALAKQIFADQVLCAELGELIEMYEKAVCRGCGSAECECTYDPRVELEDDPARGAR